MNISAISFDVDATLIDTDQIIMRSMQSVRDELIKSDITDQARAVENLAHAAMVPR